MKNYKTSYFNPSARIRQNMLEMKTRIVDCFIFYNELDMLEYRLSIMYPHVDAFVLVESTRTFIGTPKLLYYHENRERYAKYADKIVHVVIDDFNPTPIIGEVHHSDSNQWANEDYQRNAISLGIEYLSQKLFLQPTDIIIVSDADEIMDITKIPRISFLMNNSQEKGGFKELWMGYISIRVHIYYFHLCNKVMNEEDNCIRICNYDYYCKIPWLEKESKQRVRDITKELRLKKMWVTDEICGWHMSYFGSLEENQNKIKHFSHQEYNQEIYTNTEHIRECMVLGKDLFERDYNTRKNSYFKHVKYHENDFLPPFPPCPANVNPYTLYPFSLYEACINLSIVPTHLKPIQTKQRIVDCFIFYNELDMLEYRLSIMYPHVDAFVLVESTRTHKGNPKPLYYKENRARFAAYEDKIVYVLIDDLIAEPVIAFDLIKGEQWVNERHQRDGITLGIDALMEGKFGWKLGEKDVLLISDVDEIVDVSKLDRIVSILESEHEALQGMVGITMDMYYYNLNYKMKEIWTHPKAIYYSYYLNLPFTEHPNHPEMKKVRNISIHVRLSSCSSVVGSFGWHLSYFGNAEMISNKLKEFGHQEYNSTVFTNVDSIQKRIENGLDILGRDSNSFIFDKIELSENPYLPPFSPGSNSFSQFPFCLGK